MAAGPVQRQVERALLDARSTGFALQRLGVDAPASHAWRCTQLGDAIVAAIDESFPGVL